MLRLGRLVYGRLLFAMQIFVLAVRLCLKRDFRHIAHQSRQSLIAITSLRFALGFCRRSSPAAACSIICHDIARMFEASDFSSRSSFFCCIGANASPFCSLLHEDSYSNLGHRPIICQIYATFALESKSTRHREVF